MEKSSIYICGIQDSVARELSEIMHMPIGELPFKYLMVPLTSKKLSYAQSKPLVEKITSRAQTWMAHLLSYAGRLQLVKSILSMQNYCFLFPRKLLRLWKVCAGDFYGQEGLRIQKKPLLLGQHV